MRMLGSQLSWRWMVVARPENAGRWRAGRDGSAGLMIAGRDGRVKGGLGGELGGRLGGFWWAMGLEASLASLIPAGFGVGAEGEVL